MSFSSFFCFLILSDFLFLRFVLPSRPDEGFWLRSDFKRFSKSELKNLENLYVFSWDHVRLVFSFYMFSPWSCAFTSFRGSITFYMGMVAPYPGICVIGSDSEALSLFLCFRNLLISFIRSYRSINIYNSLVVLGLYRLFNFSYIYFKNIFRIHIPT